MDTSEEVNPRAQIELAEEELFKVAADGGAESAVKTFAQATTDGGQDGRARAEFGRQPVGRHHRAR